MLLGIHIKNYRILRDVKMGIQKEEIRKSEENPQLAFSAGMTPVFALSELTAVIGRNNTGKSIFFDALSFISDSLLHGCTQAAVINGRSGFSDLIADKKEPFSAFLLFLLPISGQDGIREYYLSYEFCISADVDGRPSFSCECVMAAKKEEPEHFFSVLSVKEGKGEVLCDEKMQAGGVLDSRISAVSTYGTLLCYEYLSALFGEISHWYFCDFSSGKKKNITVAPGGHRHLNEDGSNYRNVCDRLLHRNPAVLERIAEKIPDVKHKESMPDLLKESPDKLLLYLLLLEDQSPRPLLCMETPDNGLYHDMVDILAQELRNYVINRPFSQVFYTTHSPYILESMAPQEVWVFEKNIPEKRGTNVRCAASFPVVSEMYERGVGLGAVWYAGHFDDE